MVFYEQDTLVGLIMAGLPAIISLFVFHYTKKIKLALLLLILSGLAVRLLMISLDPYLEEWDERFHALVAKSMMENPFRPMLRVNPIMPYDPGEWCCGHIWVHKQPLFLWQMALSMHVFGINEFAVRLPSAILGAISILMIYEIGKFWVKDSRSAFLASLLFSFSYYQLELTTARFSVDHNDVVFTFYVTAAIWALVRYIRSNYRWEWAIMVGLFVGCAILNKWLTALLIFGGWGLILILDKDLRLKGEQYLKFLGAIIVCCAVFLPWQLYIINTFPIESGAMYAHNRLHIFEVIGEHGGNVWYHLEEMLPVYGKYLLPFTIIGLAAVFINKRIYKPLTISFVVMVLVIYGFFSIVVATKLTAFTYPVSSIILVLTGYGIVYTTTFFLNNLSKLGGYRQTLEKPIFFVLFVVLGLYSLKPWNIIEHRSRENEWRKAMIHNAGIYKSFEKFGLNDRVIINCKTFDDVTLMFYQDVNAYSWYPDQRILDSLQTSGYQFAVFKNHNNQNLPGYIFRDKDIVIIDTLLY